MAERKILTQFLSPPISTLSFDWLAFFDDHDGEGPTGTGPTEQDAINDLIESQQ